MGDNYKRRCHGRDKLSKRLSGNIEAIVLINGGIQKMKYNFGLIGYPIKQSLSPWIHKQFMEMTNIEGSYELMEIDVNSDFAKEIKHLKNSNINGFNVTVPYKEKIIPFLDRLDVQAEKMGAVNTVLFKNGEWIGYNTDGIGYVRSLMDKFPQLKKEKEKHLLILGAGGAAKGIYHALIASGFNDITIANRSLERAKAIAAAEASTKVITLEEAQQQTEKYDIIIQTTSVGMKPNVDQSVIALTKLKDGAIVSDIVYQPLVTSLLKQAMKLGANIHYGHTMLLYQAQYAFEIWTNKRPEVSQLDGQLKKILEG